MTLAEGLGNGTVRDLDDERTFITPLEGGGPRRDPIEPRLIRARVNLFLSREKPDRQPGSIVVVFGNSVFTPLRCTSNCHQYLYKTRGNADRPEERSSNEHLNSAGSNLSF